MSLQRYLATLAATCVIAMPAFAEGIIIRDAYARSASANAKAGAVFLQIINQSDHDDRLIGVASSVAALVQLHTHLETETGVMTMIHVEDGFAIPEGAQFTMERGGAHVMLMGLNRSLVQGDTVPIALTFETAGEMIIDVVVDLERQPGSAPRQMDHSGHSAGD